MQMIDRLLINLEFILIIQSLKLFRQAGAFEHLLNTTAKC